MRIGLCILFCFVAISGKLRSQTLNPVGNGIPSTYGIYGGTVSFMNELYAADVDQIYKWNGTTWSSMGITVDHAILCMTVYNNELYIAGWFEHFNGNPANRIIKYDGNVWQACGNGIIIPSNWTSGVDKMIVYNNKLIVMGAFIQAGNVSANNIASWDGVAWDTLGSGIGSNSSLPSMCVWNNELYVFAQMTTAGGVPVHNAAKWNGTNWSAVGWPSFFWPVSSVVYNNNLYVGAWISAGDTSSMIVKWDGTNWSDVEQNLSNATWNVPADLTVFNGCLYAAGLFDTIDGVGVSNVARYDGSAWFAVGNGVNGWGNFFSVLNNELYLTGDFSNSGSTVVNNVVKVSQAPVCVTTVDDRNEDNLFSVYPNPTSGMISIEGSSDYSIESTIIRDIQGNVLLVSNSTTIDLSGFASGVYFLHIETNNGRIVKRIIRE